MEVVVSLSMVNDITDKVSIVSYFFDKCILVLEEEATISYVFLDARLMFLAECFTLLDSDSHFYQWIMPVTEVVGQIVFGFRRWRQSVCSRASFKENQHPPHDTQAHHMHRI